MQNTIDQLLVLRGILLRALAGVAIISLVMVLFAKPIYAFIAEPLLTFLPANSQMIAIDVATPFLVPLKLALVLSVFLAMPWIFYQLWQFIAPGLYRHEKRFFIPLLAVSIGLFYLGIVFAYCVVLPLVFAFFIHSAPQGVLVMTDIATYLNFVLKLFFAFGLAFQVPVVILVLSKLGVLDVNHLAKKRPYVIIGAFVLGMLLTPPDMISQTLLAIPLWLLFECGVYLAKRFPAPLQAREHSQS